MAETKITANELVFVIIILSSEYFVYKGIFFNDGAGILIVNKKMNVASERHL